jgi:uncharacterized protein YbdZ (MbtH family)
MIGQDIDAARAMIVLVDKEGQAHAWDVTNVQKAGWEWTGRTDNRSTAKITIEGEFHRRTRNLEAMLRSLHE